MKTIISFIKKLLRQSSQKKQSSLPIDAKFLVPRQRHRISKTHISVNALKVIQQLHHAGYQAYLVGGGVRDLLFNQQPKDFDVATNATPNEIRKLFRNARIIGRRFKLVHVWFHRETIEVATFRAAEPADENHKMNDRGIIIRDNVYGNLFQDAERRDFTINALYYAVEDGSVIDLVGGMSDITSKILRMIGNPSIRYQEDPVRMLRVVRFLAKLDLTIDPKTEAPLLELHSMITEVSNSRLFDEVVKIYHCGQGVKAHDLLIQYRLFENLFPSVHHLSQKTPAPPVQILIRLALESTDARIKQTKPVTPAFLFAILLWFPLQERAMLLQESGIAPLPALEQAMSLVLSEQNQLISIPRRYTQIIREIWLLQYRLPKRLGGRAQHLLTHPRFRAAYDMLALRALAQDAPSTLADWWTQFQEVGEDEQTRMVKALLPKRRHK